MQLWPERVDHLLMGLFLSLLPAGMVLACAFGDSAVILDVPLAEHPKFRLACCFAFGAVSLSYIVGAIAMYREMRWGALLSAIVSGTTIIFWVFESGIFAGGVVYSLMNFGYFLIVHAELRGKRTTAKAKTYT